MATEGTRAAKTRQVLVAAVDKTLAHCTIEKTQPLFPFLAAKERDNLDNALRQMRDYMKDSLMQEYDVILAKRGLVEKLNSWDEAVESSGPGDDVVKMRPMPGDIVTALGVGPRTEELAKLRKELEAVKVRVGSKLDKMRELRKRQEALTKEVSEMKETLAGFGGNAGQVPVLDALVDKAMAV